MSRRQKEGRQSPPWGCIIGAGMILGGFLILGVIWLTGLSISPTATAAATVGTVQVASNATVLIVAFVGVVAIAIAVVAWGTGGTFLWHSKYEHNETYNVTQFGSQDPPEWLNK